jgi:predicted GNAT superfamily acetyltransferase
MTVATDLSGDAASAADPVGAVAAAESAARAAGVRVRHLERVAEFEAVCALYDDIWRPAGKNGPVTPELLRAMTKAGSYVGGAFDGEELVGACMGFFAPPEQRALHSHIAGVSARMRGRNVGFALKLHQRAWALLRGLVEISWTFDPLVGRNAYFNLTKLAAEPVEYLENFYGQMADGINGGDDTDRLLVRWRPDAPAVVAASSGEHRPAEPAGAPYVLDVSPAGDPVTSQADAPTVLVRVPRDIESLRIADPAQAARWRAALREVLGGLLADGARIRGFDRSGRYIIDRRELP